MNDAIRVRVLFATDSLLGSVLHLVWFCDGLSDKNALRCESCFGWMSECSAAHAWQGTNKIEVQITLSCRSVRYRPYTVIAIGLRIDAETTNDETMK
jgi:hypothetical protein